MSTRVPGSAPEVGAAERQRYEQLLLARREAIRAELMSQLSESGRAAASAAGPQVHDWKDEAFMNLLTGIQAATAQQWRDELAAITAALQRLTDGTYGWCVHCGRQISAERLQIQPAARFCVSCQQRQELRDAAALGRVRPPGA